MGFEEASSGMKCILSLRHWPSWRFDLFPSAYGGAMLGDDHRSAKDPCRLLLMYIRRCINHIERKHKDQRGRVKQLMPREGGREASISGRERRRLPHADPRHTNGTKSRPFLHGDPVGIRRLIEKEKGSDRVQQTKEKEGRGGGGKRRGRGRHVCDVHGSQQQR